MSTDRCSEELQLVQTGGVGVRAHDAVSSGVLGGVECAVGEAEEAFARIGVVGHQGDPETRGDRQVRGCDPQIGDRVQQPGRGGERAGG